MPPIAATRSKRPSLRVGAVWEASELVFATEAGRTITASGLRRSYEPLLKRAGLPRMRFHDLRHTSATLLLGRGVHPKVVSDLRICSGIRGVLNLLLCHSSSMRVVAAGVERCRTWPVSDAPITL